MSLSANDTKMSAVTVAVDDASSKAVDESTTCPVKNIFSVILSNDDGVSEDDDESATQTTSNMENGVDDDESAAYCVSKVETEADDESATHTISKTEMEQILKAQTEETRLNLLEIAADPDVDEDARSFVETVAEIIDWWQEHAEEQNPTSHQIDFGVGSINLLMVLALVPEKYQGCIRIGDQHRSPFANGENLSWLHEQTMDLLVGLSIDPIQQQMVFGQGLASLVRDEVDDAWRAFTGRSWLEDQIHLLSNEELESDLYHFPPETEKIVFLFNPTEVHWTVVDVDLGDAVWTYTLYNSLFPGEKGPTWKACQEQFPLLEKLICRASGFTEPETREIVAATSAQQDNPYDCGPIAIYNAIELLDGWKPKIAIDTENLRLRYLLLIVDALYLLDEDLETPELRARMRKLCLDYPMQV